MIGNNVGRITILPAEMKLFSKKINQPQEEGFQKILRD
jgi:hypothetical protein